MMKKHDQGLSDKSQTIVHNKSDMMKRHMIKMLDRGWWDKRPTIVDTGMASSSGTTREYPKRLYDVGKTPIQSRSMNHSCFLANLQPFKEAVGEDVWAELRESAVGVIVKLKEMEYIWSAKAVHYFLANQLAIKSMYEIWSLIDCMPLRFSLYEFEEITGLNCDLFDQRDVWDVDHREFWLEMEVPTSEGPTLKELQAVLVKCRNWSREKRVMVGLLGLLHIGIFGIGSNSRIPLHCAKRVMDSAAFQRYPWGRIGFSRLVESIKMVSFQPGKSYTVHGCVHVLLVWIYEFVPGVGEHYGNRIEGADVPLLSWGGSRTHINFQAFCDQEKIQYQKVRVRHMVMKPMEDRYPKWLNDEMDNERENLIKDIINGQLNYQFWDVTPTTNSPKKRQFGVAASVIPNFSPPTKRQKGKAPAHEGETADMFAAQNVAILGLVDSLTKLTEKIEGMDVSVAEKVTKSLEGTIQDKVDATMGPIKDELLKKIASLEEDVKFLKNKADEKIPQGVPDFNSENSKANEDEDASSNDLSWKIEKKINSADGLPIQSVVKKEKKTKKTTEKEEKEVTMEKEDLDIEEVALPLKKVKKEKKDVVRLKPVKKEKEDGRLKRVKKEKKAIDIPQLKDESISSQEWEEHLKWEKTKQCRQVLEELATGLEEPTRRRKPQLTKTQQCPYVGNSTVKRIISDSKNAYDPLAKVEAGKLQKLLDFIKKNLDDEEISYGDNCGQFYLKLMVPREVWPTPNYGWLGDGHMAAALLMFHRRSMLSTSPYVSSRIAFLDRWFVNSWVNDYNKMVTEGKPIELSDMYSKAFNGEYPEQFVTGRKWLTDVDSLLTCHHVNGNHWVGLHIDFPKKTVHVYDSIPSVVPDERSLRDECRAFMKMIPLVLNKMVPVKIRKKTEKQFTLRRHKCPPNDDPGDCGVYSLKYIECVALGRTWDGLSDQIIPGLRLKLAADIFEEAREVFTED